MTEDKSNRSRRWRRLYKRMQTPEAREAVDSLFAASPSELGRAAVAHATEDEGDMLDLEDVPCEDCGAARSICNLGLCPECMGRMLLGNPL